MVEIREFEDGDVAAVAGLLRSHMPRWGLEDAQLAATALDYPWADPEMPSLVAVADEGVVGFVSAQVRRMRFDGRPIRGVCASDLIITPERRSGAGAPGAQMLTRILAGPQEVSWSDTTTDSVVRAWRGAGGGVDHVRAAEFMLILRPRKWMTSIMTARLRGVAVGEQHLPVKALPVQALRGGSSTRTPLPAGLDGCDASPAEIADCLAAISKQVRVYVDWDEAQLAHTLDLISQVGAKPTCRLVRRRGRPIGWYVYLQHPGGVSRLLHLGAGERTADAVFGELLDHAGEGGSTAIAGRAEPHMEWALRRRGAALGLQWQPVIRTGDTSLSAALASGSSLLSRLDGELTPAEHL